MSWCEQLTSRAKLPEWSGPAQVHLKLSAGDEAEPAKPEPEETADKRFCPACERDLPATTAHFYSHTVRGKPYLHTKCKCCMRAEQAIRDSQRRRGAGSKA